jgi:hypothetical protein
VIQFAQLNTAEDKRGIAEMVEKEIAVAANPSQAHKVKAHTADLAVTQLNASKRICPLISRLCATSSINWDEVATIECLPAARSVRMDVKDAMNTE